MHTYLIALGSNLGDRKYYIGQAIDKIRGHCGKVLEVAPLMETAPLGAADQLFINSALICESRLEPRQMLKNLLAIEKELGRIRTERWGNRTIDLDVILWQSAGESQTYNDSELTIPHPEACLRDFVLGPCKTIAGDWKHPLAGKTLTEIWAESGF